MHYMQCETREIHCSSFLLLLFLLLWTIHENSTCYQDCKDWVLSEENLVDSAIVRNWQDCSQLCLINSGCTTFTFFAASCDLLPLNCLMLLDCRKKTLATIASLASSRMIVFAALAIWEPSMVVTLLTSSTTFLTRQLLRSARTKPAQSKRPQQLRPHRA